MNVNLLRDDLEKLNFSEVQIEVANITGEEKKVQSPKSKVQSQEMATGLWTLDVGPWTFFSCFHLAA
jgi:hypothetical protein